MQTAERTACTSAFAIVSSGTLSHRGSSGMVGLTSLKEGLPNRGHRRTVGGKLVEGLTRVPEPGGAGLVFPSALFPIGELGLDTRPIRGDPKLALGRGRVLLLGA